MCANIYKFHADSKILHVLIFLVILHMVKSEYPSSSSSVNLYTLTKSITQVNTNDYTQQWTYISE